MALNRGASTLERTTEIRSDPETIGIDQILMNQRTEASIKLWSIALLLEAGALETDDLRKRWQLRSRADAVDDRWVATFHEEPMLVPGVRRLTKW